MRIPFLVPLLLTATTACVQNTNTNTARNGSDNPTSPSGPCDAIATSINVDVESGESGGKGTVGIPLVFSADPRDAAGNSVPRACLSGVIPSAQASGACTAIDGAATFDAIATVPTTVGVCVVNVNALGAHGSKAVEVVAP